MEADRLDYGSRENDINGNAGGRNVEESILEGVFIWVREMGGDILGGDGADDAVLGDEGGDEARRCDVEGGVVDVDSLGGGGAAEAVGDLAGVSLFDGDA